MIAEPGRGGVMPGFGPERGLWAAAVFVEGALKGAAAYTGAVRDREPRHGTRVTCTPA